MNNKTKLVMAVGISLVVGVGGGFYGGTVYQKNQRQTFNRQISDRANGQRQGMNGNTRPLSGEVIAVDENSVTVKLLDGSSKIAIISNKTVYMKSSTGVKNDVKTGEKVMVIGTTNSDGSVTATNISIGNEGYGFRGGQSNN